MLQHRLENVKSGEISGLRKQFFIPALRDVIWIFEGEEVSKPKISKKSMNKTWNFKQDGGFNPVNPL